jgi:hypothetical protein
MRRTMPDRPDTDEFERMLHTRDYATIHEVAAVVDLRDLLDEVQGALDRTDVAPVVEPLPTRR